MSWFSFFRIGVPAGIGPLSVAQHKNLCNAPGSQRSLALQLRFIQVLTVGDGNVAKTLNFRAWKFQPNEFPTGCLKLRGGLKNLCLMFPPLLTAVDGNAA